MPPPEPVRQIRQPDPKAPGDAGVGDAQEAVEAQVASGILEQAVVALAGTRRVLDRVLAGELERLGFRASRGNADEGHWATSF